MKIFEIAEYINQGKKVTNTKLWKNGYYLMMDENGVPCVFRPNNEMCPTKFDLQHKEIISNDWELYDENNSKSFDLDNELLKIIKDLLTK